MVVPSEPGMTPAKPRLDVLHISAPYRTHEENVAQKIGGHRTITRATSNEVRPKTSSRGSLREGESGVVKKVTDEHGQDLQKQQ